MEKAERESVMRFLTAGFCNHSNKPDSVPKIQSDLVSNFSWYLNLKATF
jgi:hypothetical protein